MPQPSKPSTPKPPDHPALKILLEDLPRDRRTRRSLHKLIRLTKTYFSQPKFDASHDFNHVIRVILNACWILHHENLSVNHTKQPRKPYDKLTVLVGALLHDVGDRKYLPRRHQHQPPQIQSTATTLLRRCNFSRPFIEKIIQLLPAISYTTEINNPNYISQTITSIPETSIIQDADRLDALGAVGMARAFTYAATVAATTGRTATPQAKRGLKVTMEHCHAKLWRLTEMMKTRTGRKEAGRRTRWMKGSFGGEWGREVDILGWSGGNLGTGRKGRE